MIACDGCGNKKIKLVRYIFKDGSKHIQLICNKCLSKHYIERTPETMSLTMNQEWKPTKARLKKLIGNLHIFPGVSS